MPLHEARGHSGMSPPLRVSIYCNGCSGQHRSAGYLGCTEYSEEAGAHLPVYACPGCGLRFLVRNW